MPNDLLEQLSALLNLPDLIIIAAVLVNMILGFRRGFFFLGSSGSGRSSGPASSMMLSA